MRGGFFGPVALSGHAVRAARDVEGDHVHGNQVRRRSTSRLQRSRIHGGIKNRLTCHGKIILAVAVLRKVPTKRRSVGLIPSSALLWDRTLQTGSLSIQTAVERAVGRAQAGRISQERVKQSGKARSA